MSVHRFDVCGNALDPGEHAGKVAGDKDSIPNAKVYLDSLISTRTDRPRKAYLATGVEAVDVLHNDTDMKFVPCGAHPDCQDKDGAAISGRAIVPTIVDARVLGRDFEHVRPPIKEFMVFGVSVA